MARALVDPSAGSAAVLAHHWFEAGRRRDAAVAALQAADHAQRVHSQGAAHRHLERVLELWDDLPAALSALGSTPRTAHGLTRRELEVLALLATGVTNRTIAERLHVTTRTVDTHVSRILTKLGVPTRAAATAFAHRHGLV